MGSKIIDVFLGDDFLVSYEMHAPDNPEALEDPDFVAGIRGRLLKSGYSDYTVAKARFDLRDP